LCFIGPVVQWLEHPAHNGVVVGSNPARPTTVFLLYMALSIKNFKYYIEYFLLKGFFGFLRLMPMKKSASFCAFIIKFISPCLKANKTAYRNLHMVFPYLNTKIVDKIIMQMWDNLGRNIGEFPHIASLEKSQILDMVQVNNVDILKKLNETYDKIIIVSAHFGNWELLAKVAHEYEFPLSLVYRSANNHLTDNIFNQMRAKYTKEFFAKGSIGARSIIKAMNRGNCLLTMLIDQKINTGVMSPFMGHLASTSTAAAEMAMRFKCPILPVNIVRQGKSSNFVVNISDPIYCDDLENNNNEKLKITNHLNEILGDWIAKNPEQWFWVHNRWPKVNK
jgi:Kdo2-lipid IVA lauroyltransferase/acyltransferase